MKVLLLATPALASCYVYGGVLGVLDYIEVDDLTVIKSKMVGESANYLNSISFKFGETSFLQSRYSSTLDQSQQLGPQHGAQQPSGLWQIQQSSNTLGSPLVFYSYQTNSIVAFGFKEISWQGAQVQQRKSWVLQSESTLDLDSQNAASYSQYQTFTETATCLQGDLKSTTIVGFHTTQRTPGKIKSLQAIYYSTDQSICYCLSTMPKQLAYPLSVTPQPVADYTLAWLLGTLSAVFVTIQLAPVLFILCVYYFASRWLCLPENEYGIKQEQVQLKIDAIESEISKYFPDGKVTIQLSESFQRSQTLRRHSKVVDPLIEMEIQKMMSENVVVELAPPLSRKGTRQIKSDEDLKIKSFEILDIERTEDPGYLPITGQKKTSRKRQDSTNQRLAFETSLNEINASDVKNMPREPVNDVKRTSRVRQP